MSIFKKESENINTNQKSDFEKIGVHVIKPFKKGTDWIFTYDGQEYLMAPAQIVTAALSPVIVGVDNFIKIGCEAKNIKNPEDGFNLLFSTEYFPTCDVKLVFKENFYDGYIYTVEPINYMNVMPGQSVFMCSFINIYYKSQPKELYLKAEQLS